MRLSTSHHATTLDAGIDSTQQPWVWLPLPALPGSLQLRLAQVGPSSWFHVVLPTPEPLLSPSQRNERGMASLAEEGAHRAERDHLSAGEEEAKGGTSSVQLFVVMKWVV